MHGGYKFAAICIVQLMVCLISRGCCSIDSMPPLQLYGWWGPATRMHAFMPAPKRFCPHSGSLVRIDVTISDAVDPAPVQLLNTGTAFLRLVDPDGKLDTAQAKPNNFILVVGTLVPAPEFIGVPGRSILQSVQDTIQVLSVAVLYDTAPLPEYSDEDMMGEAVIAGRVAAITSKSQAAADASQLLASPFSKLGRVVTNMSTIFYIIDLCGLGGGPVASVEVSREVRVLVLHEREFMQCTVTLKRSPTPLAAGILVTIAGWRGLPL